MKTNFNSMDIWEVKKANFLVLTAKQLNMNLNCFGELSVNQSSGYTYLFLEDYSFTLFMNLDSELKRNDVYVLWTDSYTGEEVEESLSQFNHLGEIEEWANQLDEEYEQS